MRRGEKEVDLFSEAMKEKLGKNAHKGTWRVHSILKLLWLGFVEALEVVWALLFQTPRAVTEECADLALFSMFVADKVGGLKG